MKFEIICVNDDVWEQLMEYEKKNHVTLSTIVSNAVSDLFRENLNNELESLL